MCKFILVEQATNRAGWNRIFCYLIKVSTRCCRMAVWGLIDMWRAAATPAQRATPWTWSAEEKEPARLCTSLFRNSSIRAGSDSHERIQIGTKPRCIHSRLGKNALSESFSTFVQKGLDKQLALHHLDNGAPSKCRSCVSARKKSQFLC